MVTLMRMPSASPTTAPITKKSHVPLALTGLESLGRFLHDQDRRLFGVVISPTDDY